MKCPQLLVLFLSIGLALPLAAQTEEVVYDLPSDKEHFPKIAPRYGNKNSIQLQLRPFLNSNENTYMQLYRDPNYEISGYAMMFDDMLGATESMFASEGLRKDLLAWATPTLKAWWADRSYHEKAAVYQLLNEAHQYLISFDLASEKTYWETMKDRLYPIGVFGTDWGARGESLFVRRSPTDFYGGDLSKPMPFINPYRRLHTFFYRRALNGVEVSAMINFVESLQEILRVPENLVFEEKFEDGRVKEKGAFKNGKPEGEWLSFTIHSKSKKYICTDAGTYDMGKKIGTWKMISPWNGLDFTVAKYKDGHKVYESYTGYSNNRVFDSWVTDAEEMTYSYRYFAADGTVKEAIDNTFIFEKKD